MGFLDVFLRRTNNDGQIYPNQYYDTNTDDMEVVATDKPLPVDIKSNEIIVRRTGASAIAETIAEDDMWQLKEVRIHLDAAGNNGDFKIQINSASGSVYDVLILSIDMVIVTDMLWQADVPITLSAGDAIDISWENASSKTYGLEVIYDIL